MFELADRLVGIYKTHDATKSVTINPKLFADMPVALTSASAASRGGSDTHGDHRGPSESSQNDTQDDDGAKDGDGARDHKGRGMNEPPQKIGRRHVLADSTNIH